MRAWSALLVVVAACSFDPSGVTSGDPDALDPGVDASDGAIAIDGALPDGVPPDAACVPGCDATNTMLTTCPGGAPVVETCALGCSLAPSPHCKQFAPSNGVSSGDLTGVTAAIDVPANRVFLFDTADGSIDDYGAGLSGTPTVVRPAGDGVMNGIGFRRAEQGTGRPGLGIWSVSALTVNGGGSLAQHGTLRFVGARSAIVVARGAVTMRGAIDAGAGHDLTATPCRNCGGPGGGTGATRTALATGCAPGGDGNYAPNRQETGGAGGGMSTVGANGGDTDAEGGAGSSIASCPDLTLIPLAGGGGGGRGGYDDTGTPIGGVVGGGAGGAIQLVSLVSITVAGTADIYAGGQGGEGSEFDYGGGGGGAGGAILLEAPVVSVGDTAKLTANGGGGGSGRTANVGDAGNRGTSRAAGGSGDGPGMNDGRGGRGGVAADTSTAVLLQTQGNGSVDGTGGGGASAGRIRINTAPATQPALGGAITISPAATTGTRPVE